MEERESEAGERRGKETDIKRETEDVGLGRRLAAAAAAPLDVRRVRNYRFSERLARSASRARFESLRGPSLVARSTGCPERVTGGVRPRFVADDERSTKARLLLSLLRSIRNSNYRAALYGAR